MDKTGISAQSHQHGKDSRGDHGGLCQGKIYVGVFTAESAKLLFSKWRRELWCVNIPPRHSVPFCHKFCILIITDFSPVCSLSFPNIFSLPVGYITVLFFYK